jgi:predicted esterase
MRDPFGQYLNLQTVSIPTIIIHGTQDDVVPLEPVREIAQKLFTNLTYHVVNDGHRLTEAFHQLDWEEILA